MRFLNHTARVTRRYGVAPKRWNQFIILNSAVDQNTVSSARPAVIVWQSLRPPYTLIQTVQFNCVKNNCTKNWTECPLAQRRFPIRLVSFFVSPACLLVRVTMVDKNKAVVCCLLATSAIMLSEKKKRKRKTWSKKRYLKRNISCDAHLLNELLETDVPWDDAFVVSAGKMRKLWDSLSELRSSVC